MDNRDDMEKTAGEIAKKLNKHYYDLDGDTATHMYIVGSVGRHEVHPEIRTTFAHLISKSRIHGIMNVLY